MYRQVYCDYDLLKKARDGEINIPPTASVSNPAGGKYFRFVKLLQGVLHKVYLTELPELFW